MGLGVLQYLALLGYLEVLGYLVVLEDQLDQFHPMGLARPNHLEDLG